MNRKYIYSITTIITFLLTFWIIFKYFVPDLSFALLGATICSVLGFLFGAMADGYIESRYPGFLYTPMKTMRMMAKERQKKRAELQERMLFKMQYMQGIEYTIVELNKIFTANPRLRLTRWIVFRSWYKCQIDHMLEKPDIYHLTVGGEPYNKDDDPLYSPSAPDWSLYDRDHYYDDDDDYEYRVDDDDFDDLNIKERSSDDEALALGIGIGVASGLTGDSVFGGGR